MELETGDLTAKMLNGGVWGALGAFVMAAVGYWRDKKRDDSQNSFSTLGAINKGSETLMTSLLQSHKLMDEQLRRTRKDLQDTDAKLDACENKHRDAERRIEDLEKLVKAGAMTNNVTVNMQPVSKEGE